jgi:hypothetical protein
MRLRSSSPIEASTFVHCHFCRLVAELSAQTTKPRPAYCRGFAGVAAQRGETSTCCLLWESEHKCIILTLS